MREPIDPEIDFNGFLEQLAESVVTELRQEFPSDLAPMERTRRLLLRSIGRLRDSLDGPWRPPFMVDQQMVHLEQLIDEYRSLRDADPRNSNPLGRPNR